MNLKYLIKTLIIGCLFLLEANIILTIKSQNLVDLGVLHQAYGIGYNKHYNELWDASFSLPIDDPKKELCQPFNFVEIIEDETEEYIGLYRIIPEETQLHNNKITYQLEHVLATLMDSVLFKYHQPGINITTADNIDYILNRQNRKHWKRGRVDFRRFFQYSFENENGLLAPIFSIPKPFNVPYEWTYDTINYPWTLNLVEPTQQVTGELRWGKNMGSFDEVVDPTEIVNRIYPLGAGEGVNQLGIEDVNDGVPYLEDKESIAKHGLKEYIWIDKRFTNPESLKASGQSLLDQWKDPKISLKAKGSDLSMKPEFAHEKLRLGDLVEIIVPDRGEYIVRIVGESKKDLTGKYEDIEFDLNNKLDDIATTQADQERKQQVNDAYSMGATNILNFTYQDNCDSNIPAVIPFYIDNDVVNVNTVELTFRTKRFRAYSRATEGGGAIVKSTKGGGGTTRSTTEGGGTTRSTSSGGGSQQTSSSGGGTSTSTQSGGSSSQTSSNNGTHRHLVAGHVGNLGGPPSNDSWQQFSAPRQSDGQAVGALFIAGAAGSIYTQSADGAHTHSVNIPAHTHGFTVPNHTHSVNIPNHTHDVTIPAHSHSVTIPDHTHEIELPDHVHEVKHEIIELGTTPSRVTIKVDGNIVPHTSTSGDRINLVDYMSKDSSGRVTRGRHEVEILPSGLARIEADLICRVFIQSQLGEVF